jgi:hypothetical protein
MEDFWNQLPSGQLNERIARVSKVRFASVFGKDVRIDPTPHPRDPGLRASADDQLMIYFDGEIIDGRNVAMNGTDTTIEALFQSCVQGNADMAGDNALDLRRLKIVQRELSILANFPPDSDEDEDVRPTKEELEGENLSIENRLHNLDQNVFPLEFGPELRADPLGAKLIDGLEESWSKLPGNAPAFIINGDAASILEVTLQKALFSSEKHWQAALNLLRPHKSDTVSRTGETAGLGWGSSPRQLLPIFLSLSDSVVRNDSDLRLHLVAFCVYQTYVQKAKRCLRQINGAASALATDLLCARCDDWKPLPPERPTLQSPPDLVSWLLFELESGMIIRGVQCKVINKLLAVKANSTLQFDMGQGKSSLIFPVILLSASSPKAPSVGRLTVLHSLYESNYDELRMMMGGLLGRTICTFPVERSTPIDVHVLEIMYNQHVKCVNEGSTILAVPDHILSLKLMHTEQLRKEDPKRICLQLRRLLEWWETSVVDLLDESDEILRPHYSLVYAMGSRQSLVGGAARWEVSMAVLEAVQEVVANNYLNWNPGYIELGDPSQAEHGYWRQVRLISEEGEGVDENGEECKQRIKYEQLSHQILERLAANATDPVKFLATLDPNARHLVISFVLNDNR